MPEREKVSACKAAREITAHQDLGCLSAAKYVYQFYRPIPEAIVAVFSGCDIQVFRFSEYVPYAKDLIKIKKPGEFQADLIVDGFTATVYFTGRTQSPSMWQLDDFDQRLYNAGYGSVTYVSASQPHCDLCPVRHLKKCS